MIAARIKLRVKAWHDYRDAEPGYEWREKIDVKNGDVMRVDLVPHRLQRVTRAAIGFQCVRDVVTIKQSC